jgi:AraC family transcriptional regulator, regulatory protein of adaptative response / methylated-DNA-[protein]-cysteine methyltransferase
MATLSVVSGDAVALDDDERWQAVQARDGRFDGSFVYAVRSTGIYCRPSCPSRRPKRDRVVFYHTATEAERAGFRSCHRCEPNREDSVQEELVRRAIAFIEGRDGEPVTLVALGQELGISPYHLQRTFKRVTGITPRQYAESRRLARLKTRLKEGDDVTSALYKAGYGSSSRLYEQAYARLGMTPNAYRRGGQGAHVRYTIVDCSLGRLLVAATEHGVCASGIGDSDADLEAFLRAEFPAAEPRRDEASVSVWASAIVAQIEGRETSTDAPLCLQGTDFQRKVWEALRAIPCGAVRTYSEIARSLGQPTAARAVARACAANRVAVVVPCHRIIRKDGSLGGYRWGIERKQALLKEERAHSMER